MTTIQKTRILVGIGIIILAALIIYTSISIALLFYKKHHKTLPPFEQTSNKEVILYQS